MKAVIYCRFSPQRNAGEKVSCETQEAQCREYVREKRWGVRSVHYDEGVSGKTVYREGLESAIADLQRGDVLLVYCRDRLARNLFFAELLHKRVADKGARIVSVDGVGDGEGPDVKFIRQVMDAHAEYVAAMISAKTRGAMLTRQAQGQRMSKHPPYGYKADPRDPTRWAKNRTEQRAVERVHELAAEGKSIYAIAKALDEEMPKACRGKKWSRRTVAKIANSERRGG